MIVLVVFMGIYTLLLSLLLWQWLLLPPLTVNTSPKIAFTVIIPFRNEERNLTGLIDSLDSLEYPKHLVEVLFVDDNSEDQGAEMVRRHPGYRLLSLAGNSGKKAAIEMGIRHASHATIVTTDADCTVPPTWLRLFNEQYSRTDSDMCLGTVRLHVTGRSFAGAFQQMEQLALTGISGGLASLGIPAMCNGASLSYRKEAFFDVGGFSGNLHIPSGDDQFLLRKMVQSGKKISYIRNRNHTVTTPAQPGWRPLLHQRVRWAGKWRATGGILAVFAMLTGIATLSTVLSWVLLIWMPSYWNAVVGVTLIKFVVEFLLVRLTGRDLGVNSDWWKWPVFEVFYPVYAVYLMIRANSGQYVWKGRRYSPS